MKRKLPSDESLAALCANGTDADGRIVGARGKRPVLKVVAANALRSRLSRDHRIVVVDREPAFTLAASFLWVMTGDRTPAQVSRPLHRLQRKGIEVVRGEVERVDPERREAVVGGQTLHGDRLIVTARAASSLAGHLPHVDASVRRESDRAPQHSRASRGRDE